MDEASLALRVVGWVVMREDRESVLARHGDARMGVYRRRAGGWWVVVGTAEDSRTIICVAPGELVEAALRAERGELLAA